jgi:hypothetical protein
MIRHLLLLSAVLAAPILSACSAHAQADDTPPAPPPQQPQAAPPQPQPNQSTDPKVIDILDRLEARGKDIRSFQAHVVYHKDNALLGDQQTRMGKLHYLAADPAASQSARFRLDFEQIIINDALRPNPLTWVFDGQWLAERQEEKKLFIRRQVVGPGEVYDPLSVDGPFPLPLGQSRLQVLARYHVRLVEDADPSAPELDMIHLHLVPRPDVPRAQGSFDTADLWFDPDTLLPRKVATTESDATTTVTITKPRLNEHDQAAQPQLFSTQPPPPGSGWRVEVIPFQK